MMTHDAWIDRLSDWLDGELPAREHDAVTEHLEACASCREVADELAEVRGRARLLGVVEPERDLWTGIARRLGGAEEGDPVIDLTRHIGAAAAPAEVAPESDRRGVVLRVPQIAAAAVLLLLGGWAVGAMGSDLPGTAAAAGAVTEPMVVREASDLLGARPLADGMGELERRFRERAADLTPETRDRLVRSLAVIDRSLAESIAALREEPTSPWLRDHLRSGLDRRRAALESAVRLIARGD